MRVTINAESFSDGAHECWGLIEIRDSAHWMNPEETLANNESLHSESIESQSHMRPVSVAWENLYSTLGGKPSIFSRVPI